MKQKLVMKFSCLNFCDLVIFKKDLIRLDQGLNELFWGGNKMAVKGLGRKGKG